jgi:hypothetical protein
MTATTVRLMIPARRNDLPEWEISRDQHVIGWVREWHASTSTRPFYRATGIDPDTGQRVALESSADRDERIQAVQDFHEHPDASPHRQMRIRSPR